MRKAKDMWGEQSIRRGFGIICAAAVATAASAAQSQQADRTIDEIKVESLARAERGAYPLGGLDVADVREALALIRTRDPDEWAKAWTTVADRYLAHAETAATLVQADADYLRAWRLDSFGAWPAPTSAGKQAAYQNALSAYLLHAAAFDPPLEVVRIPFEGSEIVGYLRRPRNTNRPVPVVIGISGLDSRKENVTEIYQAMLPHGLAFFAIDSPGTGQSPVKASPTADRVFSRVIDYLADRPDIDRTRILVHGMSYGAYWAANIAHTERERLHGVVAQSPAVHNYFQPDTFRSSMNTREYLFDRVPALQHVYDKPGLEELVAYLPTMSLVNQGLIGKPTAALFIVGGVKDTQVPIADLDLLIHSGREPREAWINPAGGHMGREAKGWTDPIIFRDVVLPWLVRKADDREH
jgi:pimeloyl-ACP methyl ester carboxylesterase